MTARGGGGAWAVLGYLAIVLARLREQFGSAEEVWCELHVVAVVGCRRRRRVATAELKILITALN